ncbi:MAG: hypothetical protein WBN94_01300, partial [Methanothrix sp.]
SSLTSHFVPIILISGFHQSLPQEDATEISAFTVAGSSSVDPNRLIMSRKILPASSALILGRFHEQLIMYCTGMALTYDFYLQLLLAGYYFDLLLSFAGNCG